MNDSEIYPNSPLSDVACEVRFPGEMQVECERYRFWDQIRENYPTILVPHAKEGEAPALQHYRFRSADSNRAALVALHSLSYSETKYRGHQAFIQEFLRLADVFSKTYPKIKKLKRVGWRYINVMPFSRENGLLPLGRILKFKANLPMDISDNSVTIDLRWQSKIPQGTATLHLANRSRKELPDQEALMLDIDCGIEHSDLTWEGLSENIQVARKCGREIFESMITDDYREYLRGQAL